MKSPCLIIRRALTAALTCALLANCGGDGYTVGPANSPPPQPPPPPPTDESGSVVRLGVVGNPYGDGTTWLLQDGPFFKMSPSALILVDGDPVPVSSPPTDYWGEVVTLSGDQSIVDGYSPLITADLLEINHLIDGPIDAIDIAHGRLTIVGQIVLGNGADSRSAPA